MIVIFLLVFFALWLILKWLFGNKFWIIPIVFIVSLYLSIDSSSTSSYRICED